MRDKSWPRWSRASHGGERPRPHHPRSTRRHSPAPARPALLVAAALLPALAVIATSMPPDAVPATTRPAAASTAGVASATTSTAGVAAAITPLLPTPRLP